MIIESAILCIFEGESRETKYFKQLNNYYFNESSILVCSYGNDIYELFKELDQDDDLDIVEILRESKSVPSNKVVLEKFSRDDFGQVFLFFDFEYQDDHFSVDKLRKMISIFNEETINGKLFVSYPMIEAIRDVPCLKSYIDHKVSLANCSGRLYKKLSVEGMVEYNDPRKITKKQWDSLIKINIVKANFIVKKERNNYKLNPDQMEVLTAQSEFMDSTEHLYVLCSFPLFVFHQKSSQISFD